MASDIETLKDTFASLQKGDNVKHAKFGSGTIIDRVGTGDATKILVKFVDEGEKRLLAKYAKLKKVRPMEAGDVEVEE
jgi:DNA helicase-2/ATP-dependent DNA helicase PcrA